MFKQSIILLTAPVILGLSTGIVNASEIEVKAGNTQVSVQSGKIEIDNQAQDKSPSLLERLTNIRIFGDRSTSHSSSPKCDRDSTGYSTTRSNSSGTAVSRSTSSSTTMTCQ